MKASEAEPCFWYRVSYFEIAFPMDPRKTGQEGACCRADNYFLNLDCAAHRAMTGHEGKSVVLLV